MNVIDHHGYDESSVLFSIQPVSSVRSLSPFIPPREVRDNKHETQELLFHLIVDFHYANL